MRSTTEFEDFAVARTPHLFRMAWLLAGKRHDAEDLVQETLAKMYRMWPKTEQVEDPGAYAQTVLVRTFVSQRRRRSSTEQPTADVPDAPAGEEDRALRLALQAALAELAPLDRAVLVLRFFEDRSVDQVARDLGRSPGAIRNRTSRALTRIRGVLGEGIVHLSLS